MGIPRLSRGYRLQIRATRRPDEQGPKAPLDRSVRTVASYVDLQPGHMCCGRWNGCRTSNDSLRSLDCETADAGISVQSFMKKIRLSPSDITNVLKQKNTSLKNGLIETLR